MRGGGHWGGDLLGFERWQSANKGLQLGSVKDHLGSTGGVEASRMEFVLDGISHGSFPAINVSVDHRPFVPGGRMTCGGDAGTSVGDVVGGGGGELEIREYLKRREQ